MTSSAGYICPLEVSSPLWFWKTVSPSTTVAQPLEARAILTFLRQSRPCYTLRSEQPVISELRVLYVKLRAMWWGQCPEQEGVRFVGVWELFEIGEVSLKREIICGRHHFEGQCFSQATGKSPVSGRTNREGRRLFVSFLQKEWDPLSSTHKGCPSLRMTPVIPHLDKEEVVSPFLHWVKTVYSCFGKWEQ